MSLPNEHGNSHGNANGHSNGNGQGKILWWLIGGLITPTLLALFNTIQSSAQRITALEVQQKEIHWRFERLENKIDQLLERRP